MTALILGAILIPTLFLGGYPWKIALAVIGGIAMYEISGMYGIKTPSWPSFISIMSIVALIFANELLFYLPPYMEIYHLVAIGIVLLLMCTVVFDGYDFVDAGVLSLSILYIGAACYSAQQLRDNNFSLLIMLLLVVVATDTGAYLTGRLFGKHKLAPALSPNKTIEGSVGGTVIATILSAIYLTFIESAYSYESLIFIAMLLSIAAQFGDLIESSMKRHFHVKDSGTILPGHGGVLDRFDSVLFALIIASIFGIR